jgi:hypothetical protein
MNLEKPSRNSEFEKLSKLAYEYLFEQQKIVEEKYGIHQYEDWFYDQETGILTFSNQDGKLIDINYLEVGTISKITETWLWSWANPHLEKIITKDIEIVKDFGERNSFESLSKRKWIADEYDAWEMTAISAYLLKAKGAYRILTENVLSFLIYKEIK